MMSQSIRTLVSCCYQASYQFWKLTVIYPLWRDKKIGLNYSLYCFDERIKLHVHKSTLKIITLMHMWAYRGKRSWSFSTPSVWWCWQVCRRHLFLLGHLILLHWLFSWPLSFWKYLLKASVSMFFRVIKDLASVVWNPLKDKIIVS